jgi:hypothetical protein
MSEMLPNAAISVDDLDFEADAQTAPTTFLVKDLTDAVDQARLYEKQLAWLDDKTKAVKEAYKTHMERTIPEIMAGLRLEFFGMDDGSVIEVADLLTVSLSKETTKPKAIQWLKETDRTALLSYEVVLTFKKGDEENKEKAIKVLTEVGLPATVTEEVNTNTFKALLKELIDDGQAETIPEGIGMYRAKIAKIGTGSKKSKKSK